MGILAGVLLSTNIAVAMDKELDVLVYASEGGNAWINGLLILESVKSVGYEGEMVATGSCFNTLAYMEKNPGTPTIFKYSSAQMSAQNSLGCVIEATDESFVTYFYTRVPTMCIAASEKDENFTNISDWLDSKSRITVATTNAPPDAFSTLGEVLDKSVVEVLYRNTSEAIRGLLGGDTDILFTGLTGGIVSNQELYCFGQGGKTELSGIPPLSSTFPDWKYAVLEDLQYIHGFNLTPDMKEQLIEDIHYLLGNYDPLMDYINRGGMTSGLEMQELTLEDLYNSVNSWSGKSE